MKTEPKNRIFIAASPDYSPNEVAKVKRDFQKAGAEVIAVGEDADRSDPGLIAAALDRYAEKDRAAKINTPTTLFVMANGSYDGAKHLTELSDRDGKAAQYSTEKLFEQATIGNHGRPIDIVMTGRGGNTLLGLAETNLPKGSTVVGLGSNTQNASKADVNRMLGTLGDPASSGSLDARSFAMRFGSTPQYSTVPTLHAVQQAPRSSMEQLLATQNAARDVRDKSPSRNYVPTRNLGEVGTLKGPTAVPTAPGHQVTPGIGNLFRRQNDKGGSGRDI